MLEYRAASGQMLSVRYAPIDNDGLVLTYADITARKQAEEAIARKEARAASRARQHARRARLHR